jgi:hypothetical protein
MYAVDWAIIFCYNSLNVVITPDFSLYFIVFVRQKTKRLETWIIYFTKSLIKRQFSLFRGRKNSDLSVNTIIWILYLNFFNDFSNLKNIAILTKILSWTTKCLEINYLLILNTRTQFFFFWTSISFNKKMLIWIVTKLTERISHKCCACDSS